MRTSEGDRAPKTRQERETLTVSRPCIELALASLTIDDIDVTQARAFGNSLAAAADRWLLGKSAGERGRIDKAGAHRMFALAFARSKRGAPNSLAGGK